MSHALIHHFGVLPDPRIERTKKYPLIEIILLIICGTLSGCDGWKAIKDFGELKLEWLRKFLPYENGIPVDDTIARVMRRINNKAFQSCFLSWMQAVSELTNGDIIAIDGKTVRRSHNKQIEQSPIHMVSAWSSANGVVLGQTKTAEKSNEISAIPELLQVLELKGCIVTIDAMGCQTDIAKKIVQKKADYILALKGNQGALHAEVKHYFNVAKENDFNHIEYDYHESLDKGHGRLEKRRCWSVAIDSDMMPASTRWHKIKSAIMIESTREVGEQITSETRFYISSLAPKAEQALSGVRKHWGIENTLHWTLDMTFREDESRIRTDEAPENFTVIRHIALNIIRSDTSLKASVKRKRFMAALDDDFRETLIRQVI